MKFAQHNHLKNEIALLIKDAISVVAPDIDVDKAEIYKMLNPPPKQNMGEIAFGCFIISKNLKLPPPKASELLAGEIKKSELIEDAKSFGPYLNFFINHNTLAKSLIPSITTRAYFESSLMSEAPKTVIEFSQPNTHKEMHVGHMRNLCLGDALIKLHRYAGVETISTTFPGDVGTHVAKCLWFLKHHSTETAPESRKGAWLGTLYTKGNNLLEEQKGTPKEEENRAQLTQILKEVESGSGEYFDLWKQTREWSIDQMKEVYSWAGVKFDHWYWESDVDSESVKLVKDFYDKGLFVKDDSAIGIDLSEEKLGFCLLLKSDGTGLYATKDIELARRKFNDLKAEKSLYVVDNRQSLHFKQVFSVLKKMGFDYAEDCEHLQYEMVELTSGAMSSRKGNIVPIQALIEQMVEKIKKDYLAKYKGDWNESEINRIANIVASGAIKYGMTRVDSNKKIVFSMDEWLRLDGESGPYIQYVYARIQSMLKKVDFNEQEDFASLIHPSEKSIIMKLNEFNTIVEASLSQNKTHTLCGYLYELSKLFNSFYAECSVAKAESAELRDARATLSKALAITLKEGLALLGIEAPDKM